jgi:transcriptional regulator
VSHLTHVGLCHPRERRLFELVVRDRSASALTGQSTSPLLLERNLYAMLYVPPNFQETDLGILHDFIERYSFSTVISQNVMCRISHLPLLLDKTVGNKGTLVGHMARSNDQWRDFDGSRSVTCVFHGPHAYISPRWYEARPAVPTWNYAVVHATGRPVLIEDGARISSVIDQTIAKYDPALEGALQSEITPEGYKQKLLAQVVSFEFVIEELQGKFKLGQNRGQADQRGIEAGLATDVSADSVRLLEFMKCYSCTR